MIGLRLFILHAYRRQLHQPACAQRVRGQQFAAERDAQSLFRRLRHHARVIEGRDGVHRNAQPGRVEPVLPDIALAQQGLSGERLGRVVRQGARRFGDASAMSGSGTSNSGSDSTPPRAAPEAQRRMESIAQQVHHLLRGFHFQRQLRMTGAPAPCAAASSAARTRAAPKPAVAGSCPQRGGGRAHAVVQQRQRFLHAAQQCRAGGVQHDAPAAALEQVETQLFFQATDLLADGAMGQVQAFGRGAQVLQFGHRAKGGQGVQG